MKKISITRLSIRNLQRKLIRSLLLLLAVAMVTGTLFGATIFMTGMQNALYIGTYRLGADILVVPEEYESQAKSALLAGEPTTFYMDRSVYDKVLQVDGVKKASPQVFIKPSSFTCCYSVDIFLVAFDPVSDFTITPWLKEKTRLPLTDDEAIAGRSLPILAGSMVPFFGTAFTVVGTMEPTGMKFFDQSLFMTMDAAYRMAEMSKERSLQPLSLDRNKISAVLVQTEPTISPDRVAIRIAHAVDGVRAIASDEVVNTVRRQLAGLMHGIFVVCGVLWGLAMVMIGFAFYMIVNERQREFGLLRSMGAKRRQVFSLVMLEAIFISFAGGVIGLAIGSALLVGFQDIMANSLRLPYLLPPPEVLYELIGGALLFSVLTGLLSALIPSVIASRLDPYDAIRLGE
jgi:putative ABC transport system permease protein